jgi:hypothetical protein
MLFLASLISLRGTIQQIISQGNEHCGIVNREHVLPEEDTCTGMSCDTATNIPTETNA